MSEPVYEGNFIKPEWIADALNREKKRNEWFFEYIGGLSIWNDSNETQKRLDEKDNQYSKLYEETK